MPRCPNGHEQRLGLKCLTCGAALSYRDSMEELRDLPRVEPDYGKVAVLTVGYPRLSLEGGLRGRDLRQARRTSRPRPRSRSRAYAAEAGWTSARSTSQELAQVDDARRDRQVHRQDYWWSTPPTRSRSSRSRLSQNWSTPRSSRSWPTRTPRPSSRTRATSRSRSP